MYMCRYVKIKLLCLTDLTEKGSSLKRKGVKMKKKVLIILSSLLVLSCFSSCKDKEEVKDENVSMINFTDTGDSSNTVSSKKNDSEHVSSDSENVVTSREAEDTDQDPDSEKKPTRSGKEQSSVSSSGKKNTVSSVSSVSDESENNGDYQDEDVNTSHSNDNNKERVESRFEDDQSDSEEVGVSETDSEKSDSETEDTDSETENTDSQTQSEEPVEYGEFTEDDISFVFNGFRITPGDDLESVTEILGTPERIDDEENSNYKTYNYNGFWVRFARKEDSEIFTVDEIQIYSDEIETEKGLRVFMTVDDARKLYGKCSNAVNSEYRFYIGNKYMYIYAPNGIVANIGYGIDYSVAEDND